MVQRRGPGKVARWIVTAIALACVVTFAAVTIGVELVVAQLRWSPRYIDLGWLRYGLTFMVAFWIFASWLPPARLSRSLRVAVLLPALQLLVVAMAWPAWLAIAPRLPNDGSTTHFVTAFPFAAVAGASATAFALLAYAIAKRRSGEWIHGFAMLALTELLLLGLWLPIACAAWPGGPTSWWTDARPLLSHAPAQVALIVVPPTLVACAFTAFALRRPHALPKLRARIGQVLALVFAVALLTRVQAPARVVVLYTNFVPVLFVAAVVAIAALVALGASTWWRARQGMRALRRRTEGVIADGDLHCAPLRGAARAGEAGACREPVVGIEITSWLRGPRVIQRPFAVTTAQGTLPVRGVCVVGALPAATTQLRAGECMALLRPGDTVAMAGEVAATGAPFRSAAAPLADELVIAPTPIPQSAFANVTLAMWRPCVAYLVIVTAVALPALAALLAT